MNRLFLRRNLSRLRRNRFLHGLFKAMVFKLFADSPQGLLAQLLIRILTLTIAPCRPQLSILMTT